MFSDILKLVNIQFVSALLHIHCYPMKTSLDYYKRLVTELPVSILSFTVNPRCSS